jgi:penicillin-binding protein 1A
MDEAVAWLTTTALADVVAFGTGERADLHRPMAGKTGTTQEGADAWFAGYTPDLAAAVWIGFPEGRIPMVPPRTPIRVEGGNLPAELFARFGTRSARRRPRARLPHPRGRAHDRRVDTTRNCLPNPYTPPEVVAERAYLTGTEPTELCTEPTGPPTTDVPSVVGLPLEVAVRTLHNAGFTVEEREEFSVQLPPGFVVRQDPAPGSGAAARGRLRGHRARLGRRPRPVDVPDVLNLPLDRAREPSSRRRASSWRCGSAAPTGTARARERASGRGAGLGAVPDTASRSPGTRSCACRLPRVSAQDGSPLRLSSRRGAPDSCTAPGRGARGLRV